MKKQLFLVPVVAVQTATLAFSLVACGDDSDKTASPQNQTVQAASAESEDDLPNCTAKRSGEVYQLKGEDGYRLCLNKWISVDYISETEEELPNCTPARDGQTAYLNAEESIYECDEEMWSKDGKKVDDISGSDDDSETDEDDDSETDNDGDSETNNDDDSETDLDDDDTEKPSSSSDQEGSSLPPAEGLALRTLIYDSDQDLNLLFSSYGESRSDTYGSGCVGIRTGIVDVNLGSNKKPQFNADNTNATLCAGSADRFNTLFNYTTGINEISRYDLPVELNETTGMYFFDSDSILIDGMVGGFFPVDNKTNSDIIETLSPQTCTTCRTKRTSEKSPKWGRDEMVSTIDDDGYVVYTTIPGPGIDYQYCSGPGWNGGINCGGNCSNSVTSYPCFYEGTAPDVWDWNATRWETLRNHQFCMELNGQFTYKANQEAKFYSGGDLWVFVNGKLAIDLGGNHLPAPGYIDMTTLNSNYDGYMQTGKTYPIDVFFCARRTTVSTFAMYTNFRITQK